MIRPMSRRLGALITANFAAAFTVGAEWALFVVADGVFGLSTRDGIGVQLGMALFGGLMAFILGTLAAFPAYLVGLALVGIPTWWALHRAGWASAPAFIGVAAVESVLGGVAIALLIAPEAVVFCPPLLVSGAVVGWTLWRLGYEPVRPPLRPPVPPS